MRNFREEYSKTMKSLPKFQIDAAAVKDEAHHRKMVAVRRRKVTMSVASAACILLLCGVGTATAVSFQNGRVEIDDYGFAFLKGGYEAWPEGEQAENEALNEAGNGAVMTAMMKGMESADEEAAELEELQDSVGVEAEVVDVQERIYETIGDFRRSEDIVIALPEIAWLGDIEELKKQLVIVSDVVSRVYVIIEFEEKTFTMAQSDNRGYSAYASSTAFMGEAVNKRTFVNEQGIEYQVFDSVEEGEITSTHAAISVNGRDLTFSFSGYENEEVDAVLKQLDVNVYFAKE